jgi:hypothetical protein
MKANLSVPNPVAMLRLLPGNFPKIIYGEDLVWKKKN